LLKNKLFCLGERIAGALPIKIFMQLPEGQILQEGDISSRDQREPLIVLEGFVRTAEISLKIAELGILNIMNANTAICPQYAVNTDPSPIPDREGQSYLAQFSSQKEIVKQIFKLDHVYCASIEEELNY